jgi:glyoxylase-like metal-dependent hydrolase (beta-lactamase superfamily II)
LRSSLTAPALRAAAALAYGNLDISQIVDVHGHLRHVSHVEPFAAHWPYLEIVGLGLSDAVGVVAAHD